MFWVAGCLQRHGWLGLKHSMLYIIYTEIVEILGKQWPLEKQLKARKDS
jgi:hypothetical protein